MDDPCFAAVGSKVFFFEEKKQKTFTTLSRPLPDAAAGWAGGTNT
jgi:hypothetical protein